MAEGWTKPYYAKVWHYFVEAERGYKSLCGNWWRKLNIILPHGVYLDGVYSALLAIPPTDERRCKKCSRNLKV